MFKISLEELGLGDNELAVFRQTLSRPHGQILITGPTGSGKSTTLYSALDEINKPNIKIYTVEDPIERKITGGGLPTVLQERLPRPHRHLRGVTRHS